MPSNHLILCRPLLLLLSIFPSIKVYFQWASSLIPKMSMFTLAISYLTTSNLPWFMDLTFQVPMQYCSLQLWALPPSPVTSTTGHCFRFDSISILSVVYSPLFSSSMLGTYQSGEFIFQCHIFLPFHTVHGFSRQEYWRGLPLPSPVDHILSELCTMTRLSWVAPHSMSQFHWVRQGCGPCDLFG